MKAKFILPYILKFVVILFFITMNFICFVTRASNKEIIYDSKLLELSPNTQITCFCKSLSGEIWIGTLDGLFKYNGTSLESFHTSLLSKNGIRSTINSNMVKSMTIDKSGNLWVVFYSKGFCKIDYLTNKVVRFYPSKILQKEVYENDVQDLIVSQSGKIWIACENKLFVSTTTSLKLFTQIKFNRRNNEKINYLSKDIKGNIWLSTDQRLCLLSNKGIINSFSINSTRLYCTKDNIYNLGSSISLINYDSIFSKTYIPRKLISDFASTAYKTKNSFWYGNRRGLHLLNFVNGKWITKKTYNSENLNVATDVVSDILPLNSKIFWVGFRRGGIIQFKNKSSEFKTIEVYKKSNLISNLTLGLFEDTNKTLWIGHENKGVSYTRDKIYFKNIKLNPKKTNKGFCFTQVNNSNGSKTIWIGTMYPSTLVGVDLKSKNKIELPKWIHNLGSTYCITQTNNKYLLLGVYEKGLFRVKLNNAGIPISINKFNKSKFSKIIRCFYKSSDGLIYCGTDRGVFIINPIKSGSENLVYKKVVCNNMNLSDFYIMSIAKDNNDNFYFGTMNNGLLIYNTKNKNCKSYNTLNGFPNNSIKSVICDNKNKQVWISTNNGLVFLKVDSIHDKNKIITYNENNGLNEHEFAECSSCHTKDGFIYFGTNKGITYFDPLKIRIDSIAPTCHLTNLYVNYKKMIPMDSLDNRILLKCKLDFVKKINLKYSERNFAIGFIGLNSDINKNVAYKYRLVGFDNIWHNVLGSYNKAQYTNIHEGNYKFEVLCFNSDGIKSKIKGLDICVEPPFYRSVLGYIIFLFSFVCLVLFFFFLYSKIKEYNRTLNILTLTGKQKEQELKNEIISLLNEKSELLKKVKNKKDKVCENGSQHREKDIEEINEEDKKFLDQIIELIYNNMDDSDFTAKSLAKKYGLSQSYFNKKLKGLTGETALQFMRNIKLKRAAELLKEGHFNVNEVAWAVGYGDIDTFRNRFKQMYKTTPSDFIKEKADTEK